MKLKSLKVNELFGMYNYEINLFMDENITIIDALNGKGKTTVLKLIEATVDGNIYALDQIPFKNFTLLFDNDDIIEVNKKDIYKTIKDTDISKYRNEIVHGTGVPYENMIFLIKSRKYKIKLREDMLMMFMNRGRREVYYSDREPDMDYFISDFMPEGEENALFECNELFNDLNKYKKCLKIHFIKADRLIMTQQIVRGKYGSGQGKKISSVEKYSREIKEMITSYGKKFGDESEKLDRTFPKRVVDGIFSSENDESEVFVMEQIKSNLLELEKRRHELSELGLITESNDSALAIPEKEELSRETQIFLTKYIEDNITKLSIYDELAVKLELLKSIVNNRNGFSNKEMKFTKKGVIFKNDAGKEVPIDHLSSGEKNDFILFYELMFKCETGSLILIDEPEISLHVAWQIEFIDELMEICKLKNMQAIVATHSPNIVNNNWNLLVDLEDK